MSEWLTRPMRRDGQIVWVIYRLLDPAGVDEHRNRHYYPNGKMGWVENEHTARRYADGLNRMERENAASGAGNTESGKTKC